MDELSLLADDKLLGVVELAELNELAVLIDDLLELDELVDELSLLIDDNELGVVELMDDIEETVETELRLLEVEGLPGCELIELRVEALD